MKKLLNLAYNYKLTVDFLWKVIGFNSPASFARGGLRISTPTRDANDYFDFTLWTIFFLAKIYSSLWSGWLELEGYWHSLSLRKFCTAYGGRHHVQRTLYPLHKSWVKSIFGGKLRQWRSTTPRCAHSICQYLTILLILYMIHLFTRQIC